MQASVYIETTIPSYLTVIKGYHYCWKAGGVLPSENEIMPLNVSKHVAWGTDVFGDFVVCPFTRQQMGHMQCVCIESASNLVLDRHGLVEESEIIVIKE